MKQIIFTFFLCILFGIDKPHAQTKDILEYHTCIHVVDNHILYSTVYNHSNSANYSTEKIETAVRLEVHEDPEDYEGREAMFWRDKRTDKIIHEIKEYIIKEIRTYCKKTGKEFVGGGSIILRVKGNGDIRNIIMSFPGMTNNLLMSFPKRAKKLQPLKFVYTLCYNVPKLFKFEHISDYNLYAQAHISIYFNRKDVIGDNEGRYK